MIEASLPDGYAARPVTHEDLDAVLTVILAADTADLGAPDFTRDDLEADWTHRRTDLDRDAVVIVAGDRHIVGYLLMVDESPGIEVLADAYVHPEHRGKGLVRYLIAEALERAAARVEDSHQGISVLAHATPDSEFATNLVEMGFEPRRRFWRMVRAIDGELPALAPPAGVTIRPVDIDRDAEDFHRVIEDAFESHWGAHRRDLDEWWGAETARPDFDPSIWLVGSRGGRVIAALQARADADEGAGFVARLGVDTAERGRGVGGAMLRAAFHAFAARGLRRAQLSVDSENETGATRLYEREGMSPTFHVVAYSQRVSPIDLPA